MTRTMRYAGWVAGLAAVAALVACEPGNKRENGTAAPRARGDATPKVTATTYVAHGELLERRGELERAAEQYRLASEPAPEMGAAHNRVGVTLNRLGRHAEATTEFRKAVALRPNEAYLRNNLGFSLYLEKRYDEAEAELAQALVLQPAFQRARMNRGLVLARLARYDEAYEEFAQAGPEADAHYNVAVMQAEAGHYADAARELDKAIQCDPSFAIARDELRDISRLAAAEEEARIAAEKAAAEAEAQRIAAEQAAAEAEAKRIAAEHEAAAEAQRVAAERAEAAKLATVEPPEASQLAADESPLQTTPDTELAAAVTTPTGTGKMTGGPEMEAAPQRRSVLMDARTHAGRTRKARLSPVPPPAPPVDKLANAPRGHALTPRKVGRPNQELVQLRSLGQFARSSRYLRIFERIRPVLAADEGATIDMTPYGGGDAQALRTQFNELTTAIGVDAPDCDQRLREWEERLGLSGPIGLDKK